MDKDALRKIMEASGATPEQIEKAMAELDKMAANTPPAGDEGVRLTMEKFDELITETVRKALEPLTQVDRKHGMLPGGDEKDLTELSKSERMEQFMRAVIRKDAAGAQAVAQRALSEGVDSAGGYLVPEEFQNDIYVVIEEHGIIRQFGTVFPMNSDTKNLSSITSKVTAYWVGEKAQITESAPGVGRPKMIARKLAGIASMSNELSDDTFVDVYDLLVRLFAEAFAEQEDYEALRGDGTKFTGILNHADTEVITMGSGDTDFADVTFDDLQSMASVLSKRRRKGARFVFQSDITTHLMNLKSSDGSYLWTGATAQEGPPAKVRGYPWVEADELPDDADTAVSTKFALFGDLRWVALGDRKAVTGKILEEGTVGSNKLGEQDMSALRIIERVGVVVLLGDCFAVLKTAAS
jgi:HK97 family phage major capsid protein